jgi:hypothetical protein
MVMQLLQKLSKLIVTKLPNGLTANRFLPPQSAGAKTRRQRNSRHPENPHIKSSKHTNSHKHPVMFVFVVSNVGRLVLYLETQKARPRPHGQCLVGQQLGGVPARLFRSKPGVNQTDRQNWVKGLRPIDPMKP